MAGLGAGCEGALCCWGSPTSCYALAARCSLRRVPIMAASVSAAHPPTDLPVSHLQAVAAKEGEAGELRTRYAALARQYDEAVHKANLAKQVGGLPQGCRWWRLVRADAGGHGGRLLRAACTRAAFPHALSARLLRCPAGPRARAAGGAAQGGGGGGAGGAAAAWGQQGRAAVMGVELPLLAGTCLADGRRPHAAAPPLQPQLNHCATPRATPTIPTPAATKHRRCG